MRSAALLSLLMVLGCTRTGQPVTKEAAGSQEVDAPSATSADRKAELTTVRTNTFSASPIQWKDTVATATVPPSGGSVTLPGFATVTFPPGAFRTPQAVTVEATNLPKWRAIFDVLASAYRSAPALPYEIRVTTGQVGPATDFEVSVVIPDAYLSALPAGHTVRLFALRVERAPDELIERFKPYPSTFDPAMVLRAQLPKQVFDDNQRVPGVFEAVVMIGSKQGG